VPLPVPIGYQNRSGPALTSPGPERGPSLFSLECIPNPWDALNSCSGRARNELRLVRLIDLVRQIPWDDFLHRHQDGSLSQIENVHYVWVIAAASRCLLPILERSDQTGN